MAKYTMELRELFTTSKFVPAIYTRSDVEGWFKDYNLEDYLTQSQIDLIEENGIWSKDKLARKIVDHYYMREIGFETIGLFKHYVKVTMNELMEKYLPIIYSRCIEYDPLVNVDYTESFTRNKETTTEGDATSTSSSTTSGLNVGSDTPQGQINKTSILNGTYATNTSASEGTSSISDETSSSGTGNEEETYSKRIIGNSGVSATAQKMIEQYRQIIYAVDNEIIKELNTLFMGLY